MRGSARARSRGKPGLIPKKYAFFPNRNILEGAAHPQAQRKPCTCATAPHFFDQRSARGSGGRVAEAAGRSLRSWTATARGDRRRGSSPASTRAVGRAAARAPAATGSLGSLSAFTDCPARGGARKQVVGKCVYPRLPGPPRRPTREGELPRHAEKLPRACREVRRP